MCSLLESSSSNSKTELTCIQTSAPRAEPPRYSRHTVTRIYLIIAIIRLSYYSFSAVSRSSTTVLECHQLACWTSTIDCRWSTIFVHLSGLPRNQASSAVATQYRLRHCICGFNRLRHNRSRTRENNTPKEKMPQYAVFIIKCISLQTFFKQTNIRLKSLLILFQICSHGLLLKYLFKH